MIRLEPIERLDRVEIDREGSIELSGDRLREVNDAWLDLCDRNPRYFNGSILACKGYDASTGVIRAVAEQYKHHAVRDTMNLGISMLSVTAMISAPDHDRRVYLLGKRSPGTHRYGGLWELGPSGGIDVPDTGDTLSRDDLVREATREVREEIGVRVGGRPAAPLALIEDPDVGSTDLAIEISLDAMPAIVPNWEYTDTRWATLGELIAWTERSPDELIPTTVALAKFMQSSRG